MKPDVPVTIRALIPTPQGVGVFLTDGTKTIAIFIDHYVATALTMFAKGIKAPRPLTHDLIVSILAGFGARVQKVVINDLKDDTYYARLYLLQENEQGRNLIEIDARPSDSMALAIQQRCPIYVAAHVWERASDMTWALEQALQQAEEEERQQSDQKDEEDKESDDGEGESGMKVLVTGGAGYIGSVTTERLLDAGHEVVVFDNLSRGHRAAVDPRARFFSGDLLNPDDIRKVFEIGRFDAVMHFAALALVGESMSRPEIYFENNFVGGFQLVEGMRAHGVKRIIFSSTCATYGTPSRVPIDEDVPQRPENPYGESKLMFENLLRWYERLHGFRPVFLRYFNACGATTKYGEDHRPETHLIPNVLQVALGQREYLPVYGRDYPTPDGTCIRDYIHIVDLADAHVAALERDVTGAFNLGNGNGFSVLEVVAMAREVTRHPIPVRFEPRRPGDPPRLVAAAERARQILGWVPQRSDLRRILEDAWAWHRAHPLGYEECPVDWPDAVAGEDRCG